MMMRLCAGLLALRACAVAADGGHLSIMTFYDLNLTAQCGWITHAWREVGGGQSFQKNLSGALADTVEAHEKCGTKGFVIVPRDIWNFQVDWVGNLTKFADRVLPYVRNGTVVGIMLGDELRLPRKDFVIALATLRKLLGKEIILYTNENWHVISEWPDVPADLDLLSIDYYDQGNSDGLQELRQTKDWVAKTVFPKMNHSQQKLLLCPGIFGNSPEVCEKAGKPCPLAEQQKEIVKKLDGFFQWAKEEKRIAGFNPWHFDYREAFQHGAPWDQRLGAAQMPDVLAKLKEIGSFIRGKKEAAEVIV